MTKADKEGQRKAPILRFKGFTDAWEQRKLENLSEHKSGTSIEKYFSSDGLYKVISIGSYGLNNEYIDQGIRAVKNKTTESKLVRSGQLTMVLNDKTANGNLIGRCLLISTDNEFIVNQRTEIIIPGPDLNGNYAYYYLNGPFRSKVKRIAQGGTQIYVNYSSVKKQKINYPIKDEQIKISKLLKIIKKLITLYERKYQLYLLQFQKLQRVIFDNSDDFISLSYLIEIKTGNRNSQDNVKNGKYVFFDRSTEIKRLNEFDFDEEAIIIPGEGTKFAPKYINGKYALHQRSYSLYNFSQEIDSKYLYYFLMTQSNTLLRYSVGTTVPSLRVSTFDHIKVPMYSKELQIKYALTFDSLEKLMNQIKKKTNILRSLKRFLLQVLFL